MIINERLFGTIKNKKRILKIDNLLLESTQFQEELKMEQSLQVEPYFELHFDLLTDYLFAKITEFLSLEDLILMIEGEKKQHENPFFSIAYARYLSLKYVNASDRVYYYSSFETSAFRQFETVHLTHWRRRKQFIRVLTYESDIDQIFKMMDEGLPKNLQSQIRQRMMLMMTDPGIPTPPLKRQNIGIYATSPFQNFLVGLQPINFSCNSFMEQCFQNLKDFLDDNTGMYHKKLSDENFQKNISIILNSAHLIDLKNYRRFIQEGNTLNNFIVGLMALLDLWLDMMGEYLQSLEGVLILMELLVKWATFESMVASIQENLGFMFQHYASITSDSPQAFTFWKFAMAKWVKKMSRLHQKTHKIYNTLLHKQVKAEVHEEISPQLLPISYQILDPPNLFQCTTGLLEVVEKDPCDFALLLENYQDYLSDISVDEENVYWLGHSKQFLDEEFRTWEQTFCQMQQNFLIIVSQISQKKTYDLQSIKKFLDRKIISLSRWIKPRTVTHIIDLINTFEIVYCPELLKKYQQRDQNLERLNKNCLQLQLPPSFICKEYSFTCMSKNQLQDTADQSSSDQSFSHEKGISISK